MSDVLYMTEIEQLLENLSRAAIKDGKALSFYGFRYWTLKTLITRYHLNPEDAESQVAAACGEEP